MQIDEPNIILPLASSYDSRGLSAFTNTITNAVDQRKINSYYQPYKNAITGKVTLRLAKRPGVSVDASTFGTSGQVAYLAVPRYPFGLLFPWVFSTSGNDIRASDNSSTTTIVTSAGKYPKFVDKTLISGTETVVLQTGEAIGTIRAWFSSSIGTWTEITDADFLNASTVGKMEHLDGYAFVLGSSNKIYNSDLNSLTAWSSSSFITKQIKQDEPVGLAKFKNRLLAFGRETVEVFVNAGNATGSPLNTVPAFSADVGMNTQGTTGQTHYYAVCGDRLYFYGQFSKAGDGCVFSYDGENFVKVSNPAIDRIINSHTEIYSVNSVVFGGNEAVAFALDLTTASTQRWLVYVPEWNDWFEWVSTVFTPVNAAGMHLGVGSNQHQLYSISSTDNWQDAGTNYTFTHQFQLPRDGSKWKRMSMCGVIADTARSAQTIDVQFSDDDYQNFSTARTIDLTSQKPNLYRCGAYRRGRAVRLSYTGSAEVRLESFIARVD